MAYLNFATIVQQGVTQIVQLREIDSQIGHFQHILNVFGIRILNIHVWRQHTVNHLSIFRWLHARIPVITHHIGDIFGDSRHARERIMAIVREILVCVPRATEIVRSLDQHSRRSKSGERNDQMGEMEFRLEVQLNGDILLAVFRLPPGMVPRSWLRLVDDLSDAMVLQGIVACFLSCVAQETFLLLQMGHDAEAFGAIETACRRCLQAILTTD